MFKEQRLSERKVLKVKAILAMEGQAPMAGRTVDIGPNGMCISVPQPMQAGQIGQIQFDLYFDGKSTSFNVRARVSYNIFGSGEFRAGFQFLNLDLSSMTVLAKFLR